MANGNVVMYNVATFVSGIFLLEFGADKFLEHTTIVARRTGIPDTIIALFTAGAEWEELVVVISCLAQGRSSLAVGNIIGSAVSNILGAFSLGLLFRETGHPAQFDRSSRTYSLLLLIVTTFVTPVIYFPHRTTWLVCGTISIAFFAVYVVSIGWAISKGSLTAPEDSDEDDCDDSRSTDSGRTSAGEGESDNRETDALLRQGGSPTPVPRSRRENHRRRSLGYHIFYLVLGFLAICLAGYILSHAATNIAGAIGISDVLFGVIILAIATTLPEKLIAVMSGYRGYGGILVANTAGSNIFLLLLCIGVVMVDTTGDFDDGNVNIPELAVMWGSTVAFTLTIWVGGRFDRWIGGVMLASYIAFVVLEITVIHNVADTP